MIVRDAQGGLKVKTKTIALIAATLFLVPALPGHAAEIDVTALPTTVFIDSDGIVREVVTGIVSQAVLEDRIERLLSEG